jgi:hypothetical protein
MARYVALTFAMFALVAPPARGDGLPVTGTDAGAAGVTAPGVGTRYVSVRVRGRTLIAGIERRGGRILVSRITRRPLVVPAVAYDGAATGLSADGRTLVLGTARSGFPRRRSSFTVFDAETLRRRDSMTLRGHFTLDAISPDGARLYFIQSQSVTRYAVRAYDVAAGRLLPDPVVDPAEADEPMRGIPLARAMSRDGRWAYTLYDGDGKAPFIHALDTSDAQAKCIDLDMLAGRPDLMDLRLIVAGDGTVVVRDADRRPLLAVNPRTFAVHPVRGAAPAARPVADDGSGWVGPAAGVALLALLAAGALRAGGRRRPSTAH